MDDEYDIAAMTAALATRGTKLIYMPEVASTMEIGAAAGVRSALVLTDHQTAGRGRYSRQWDDAPGASVLATFVKPVRHATVKQAGTLAVSQLCVLAVYDALQDITPDAAVKIRWPNDLTAKDRKLGGVLLMEGPRDDDTQSVLFGVGLNIHTSASGGSYRATYLDACGASVRRGELVLAIDRQLDTLLPDLARLDDSVVRKHYDDVWQAASALLGRTVRINDGATATEGTVVGSPFGANLQLRLSDGSIIEVSQYGHTARLEIVE